MSRRSLTLLLIYVWLQPISLRAQDHRWPVGKRPPPRHGEMKRVDYKMEIVDTSMHLVAVTMTINKYDAAKPLDLAMPAWSPGAYHLIVPAKNVQRLTVRDTKGNQLPMRQLDRQTWRIAQPPPAGEVIVRYEVYINKMSVVRSQLTDDYAAIHGFDTFLYVVGNLQTPCRLEIKPHSDWHIATGLPAAGTNLWDARDYDILIDSPILWSRFNRRAFHVGGHAHHVVWSGKTDFNIDGMTRDTKRIVEAVWPMFGGLLPYRDYWFLYRWGRRGGGGLEHLNSTRINDGPYGKDDPDQQDRHWGVTSHEYVHAWNVKRIRPSPLGPFDYTREQYTRDLWYFEGVTSYLGDLALVHAGIWSYERYFNSLAKTIQALRDKPATRWMSAEQSSFTTWHKSENAQRARFSYYNKGLVIGLVLDMEIRRRTKGKKTLFDLTKALTQKFRRDGLALKAGEILTQVNQLTGQDFTTFFAKHVAGTTPLKFDRAFNTVGLKLRPVGQIAVAFLGVSTIWKEEGYRLTHIVPKTAAAKAGLKKGDVIIALDDKRIKTTQFSKHIRRFRPGKRVKITYFRKSELRTARVKLGTKMESRNRKLQKSLRHLTLALAPLKKQTASQVRERKRWLSKLPLPTANPVTPGKGLRP
jgi:predicted metalloprotease with PDZ domain